MSFLNPCRRMLGAIVFFQLFSGVAFAASEKNPCEVGIISVSPDGKNVNLSELGKKRGFTIDKSKQAQGIIVARSGSRLTLKKEYQVKLDKDGRAVHVEVPGDGDVGPVNPNYELSYKYGKCLVKSLAEGNRKVADTELCMELQNVADSYKTCSEGAEKRVMDLFKQYQVDPPKDLARKKKSGSSAYAAGLFAGSQIGTCLNDPDLKASYLAAWDAELDAPPAGSKAARTADGN